MEMKLSTYFEIFNLVFFFLLNELNHKIKLNMWINKKMLWIKSIVKLKLFRDYNVMSEQSFGLQERKNKSSIKMQGDIWQDKIK